MMPLSHTLQSRPTHGLLPLTQRLARRRRPPALALALALWCGPGAALAQDADLERARRMLAKMVRRMET